MIGTCSALGATWRALPMPQDRHLTFYLFMAEAQKAALQERKQTEEEARRQAAYDALPKDHRCRRCQITYPGTTIRPCVSCGQADAIEKVVRSN
jgi:hypothetical protein